MVKVVSLRARLLSILTHSALHLSLPVSHKSCLKSRFCNALPLRKPRASSHADDEARIARVVTAVSPHIRPELADPSALILLPHISSQQLYSSLHVFSRLYAGAGPAPYQSRKVSCDFADGEITLLTSDRSETDLAINIKKATSIG